MFYPSRKLVHKGRLQMTTPPQWLTLEEACERVKVSDRTFLRWINEGFLLPGIHYGGSGRLRRFDAEMLDIAIRFQDDPLAHNEAIVAKRKSLSVKKR
jgi:excisionase family DNA binding protein